MTAAQMMRRALEAEATAWAALLGGEPHRARIVGLLADRWWAEAMKARAAERAAA